MPYRLCHLAGQNGVRSTDVLAKFLKEAGKG